MPKHADLSVTHDAPATADEVAAGWRIVMPACIAVLPLGLALGVLVVQSGLQWWWAPVLAAVVFAGSMEFLLVGLLAAAAPLSQIALSTLLVNFRHVFYALSFPLHRVSGRGRKAYSTFALTDEAYALTASGSSARWSSTRILSIQGFFHLGWVLCVTAGAGVGTLIPPWVVGLDFAVTALFVVLGIESYKLRRSLPMPVLAIGCAIVAALISRENMLVIGIGLLISILVIGYILQGRRRPGRKRTTGSEQL